MTTKKLAMKNKKSKIYVINTGGTISMRRSNQGYIPAPGLIREQVKTMAEFEHPNMPELIIHEYTPLLDSANLSPEDWFKIASDIADNYQNYHGFVVLHGTDTMAYTASALSFMFDNLSKPVILTGAQLPLSEIRNDARQNLINACFIAANYQIPEVCIYFGDRLMRGNRVRKLSAQRFSAFDSPNYPPLAQIGVNVEVAHDKLLSQPSAAVSLNIQKITDLSVATFRLFPGFSEVVLDNLLRAPLKGLVLETYGTGNAPSRNEYFIRVLERAYQEGILIVNCTQCLEGEVDMRHYETGSVLRKFVVSGHDMTPEAALTKLAYLVSQNLPLEVMRERMERNLRGEISLQ